MSPPTIPAGTASIRPNPDRRSSVDALMLGAPADEVPSGRSLPSPQRSAIAADGIDPKPDPSETEDDPADDEPNRGQRPEQPEDRRQDADDDQPRSESRESARRYGDDGEDDRAYEHQGEAAIDDPGGHAALRRRPARRNESWRSKEDDGNPDGRNEKG